MIITTASVLTHKGMKVFDVCLVGKCQSCMCTLQATNPLLVNVLPLMDFDQYAGQPSTLWIKAPLLIERALMDDLVVHYLQHMSIKGVWEFLTKRSEMCPLPNLAPEDTFGDASRKKLGLVLPAYSHARQLLGHDIIALIGACVDYVGSEQFVPLCLSTDDTYLHGTSFAAFKTCLPCWSFSVPSQYMDGPVSWWQWYELLAPYCQSLISDLQRDAITDASVLRICICLVRDLLTIVEAAPMNHPARDRIASLQRSVDHMSQCNVDLTFKYSVFLKKDRDDAYPSSDPGTFADGAKKPRDWAPPAAYASTSMILLPEVKVTAAVYAAKRVQQGDDEPDCSDFRAAQEGRASSSRSHYAMEALATAVCDHHQCHVAFPVSTGEQNAYPLLMYEEVLNHGPVRLLSYDIACRMDRKIKAVIAKTKDEFDHVPPSLSIVGPLHVEAHKPDCQRKFGAMFMKGAGLPHGEMAENLNATLKRSKAGIGYTGPVVYTLSTDARLLENNIDQRSKIHDRLNSHMTVAEERLDRSSRVVDAEMEIRVREAMDAGLAEEHAKQKAMQDMKARIVDAHRMHFAIANKLPVPPGASSIVLSDVFAVWVRLVEVGFTLPVRSICSRHICLVYVDGCALFFSLI